MAWKTHEELELEKMDVSIIEKNKERRLTLKQRRFLKYYLDTGDAINSVKRAYHIRSTHSASDYADRVLKNLDFAKILEMAGVSDAQLAIKMSEGLNAKKLDRKTNTEVPDLEVRHKYLMTALESKKKIKGNKLEVTGENGQPIRFNILAGHGFIPTVSQPTIVDATPETGSYGGSSEIQDSDLASKSEKDNDSDN